MTRRIWDPELELDLANPDLLTNRLCSRCGYAFKIREISKRIHCRTCWENMAGHEEMRFATRWNELSTTRDTMSICRVEGCWGVARSWNGHCLAHISRLKRHGDLQADIPIKRRKP